MTSESDWCLDLQSLLQLYRADADAAALISIGIIGSKYGPGVPCSYVPYLLGIRTHVYGLAHTFTSWHIAGQGWY